MSPPRVRVANGPLRFYAGRKTATEQFLFLIAGQFLRRFIHATKSAALVQKANASLEAVQNRS
jgi:hypothetical protein